MVVSELGRRDVAMQVLATDVVPDTHQAALDRREVRLNGVGGHGIKLTRGADQRVGIFGGNAVYDCTTAYDIAIEHIFVNYGDNEILAASPFVDAANGDFRPIVIGNVRGSSLPQSVAGR